MGGLMTLLDSARVAGVTMRVDGERLIVRGPRSAETLAKSVLAQKADVVAWLLTAPETRVEPSNVAVTPRSVSGESERAAPAMTVEQCFCCGQRRWWRSVFGSHLICATCHPPSFRSVIAARFPNEET